MSMPFAIRSPAIAGPEREKAPEGLSDGSAAKEGKIAALPQTKRAGEGTRTLDIQLGNRRGWSSKSNGQRTYEDPQEALYRLLYRSGGRLQA